MPARQVDQTAEIPTAGYQQASPEKENVVRADTATNNLAGLGGDANTQSANLHRLTRGNLSRAGDALLKIQQQYGNQYVQQVVNQALTIQPKLMVGAVNTPSEQEADRFSRAIASGQPLSRAPTPVSGSVMPVSPQTESAINQARGSGQSLPENTQTRMSQALDTDLSGVRVHTDSRADSLNQSLQAKAFTAGQDIFFEAILTPEKPENLAQRQACEAKIRSVVADENVVQELIGLVPEIVNRPSKGSKVKKTKAMITKVLDDNGLDQINKKDFTQITTALRGLAKLDRTKYLREPYRKEFYSELFEQPSAIDPWPDEK